MRDRGPRSVSIGGPSTRRPESATSAPTIASNPANRRGAVPGPKAKPCVPGRSPEVKIAIIAKPIRASPP